MHHFSILIKNGLYIKAASYIKPSNINQHNVFKISIRFYISLFCAGKSHEMVATTLESIGDPKSVSSKYH